MRKPDIVYMVRPGDDNEELRYSLRSLKNLPHRKVVMVGHKPAWAQNVTHIARDQAGMTKYENTRANWIAACKDRRVSTEFLLFNDDFFVMRPIERVPVLHRGDIAKVASIFRRRHPNSYYTKGMLNTAELLRRRGMVDIKCYELHVPMTIHKRKYLEMMKECAELVEELTPVQSRTVFGNLMAVGGEETSDVKVYQDHQLIPTGDFISTRDGAFKRGKIGRHIRKAFTEPSPYEVRA